MRHLLSALIVLLTTCGAANGATFFQYLSAGSSEPIGRGASGIANSAAGAALTAPSTFTIAFPGSPSWHIEFSSAPGSTLLPGSYVFNTPTYDYTSERLVVTNLDTLTTCTYGHGQFTIHELVVDAGGAVLQFAGDFEDHCVNAPAAFYGGVRFNSAVPYTAPTPPLVATRVFVVGPNKLSVPAGGTLSDLRFRAEDDFGHGVPGEHVIFTVPTPGCGSFPSGSLGPIDGFADANGFVTAPPFIAGPVPGMMCGVAASLASYPDGTRSGIEIDIESASPPPSPPPPPPVVGDLWWAGAGESGWGLNIDQHGEKLFVVIYAYDWTGAPTWFVMPAGTWDEQRKIYSGLLYWPRGMPYYAYDSVRFIPGNAVGAASLSFRDADHAVFAYTVNSMSGSKWISRQRFGADEPFTPGRGDMWWGGIVQNGWGFSVTQQYASLFSVWYTYDGKGAPTWFVMPAGAWTSSDTYEGRVYRTTGSAWIERDYDASQLKAVDVGTFRLRFAGDDAQFEYNIEGRAGALPLQRQGF